MVNDTHKMQFIVKRKENILIQEVISFYYDKKLKDFIEIYLHLTAITNNNQKSENVWIL